MYTYTFKEMYTYTFKEMYAHTYTHYNNHYIAANMHGKPYFLRDSAYIHYAHTQIFQRISCIHAKYMQINHTWK